MSYLSRAEPSYRLADHVRACLLDEQVILLDLRRNRYLGVGGGRRLATLSQVIKDWPIAPADTSCADEAEVASFIAPLANQGMLASSLAPGPSRPFLSEPLQTLAQERAVAHDSFEWRQLMSLWLCAAVASRWIRYLTLADIVGRVSHAKRQVPSDAQPADDALSTDDALRAAVAAYMRVRPFAFTAYDRCLHDSLTLTRYLAGRHLFPQWVIGVKTNPFGAHSWVQSGHVVLNDLHENVRRFRPILVV